MFSRIFIGYKCFKDAGTSSTPTRMGEVVLSSIDIAKLKIKL